MRSIALWPLVLIACAASPPPPTRTELVVDQPSVVHGRQRRGDQVHVPPLVPPLEQSSPAFQRGYALAWDLLAAEGPPPPLPADKAAYDRWLDEQFEPWFAVRSADMSRALEALNEATRGSPGERVAVAALAGLLSQRLHGQVLGVMPPPGIAQDEKLRRIYENEMNRTVGPWAAHAHTAFKACSSGAAVEREHVFGLWLELCQKRLTEIDAHVQRAAELAQAVLADEEADRIAREGPRPQGPEICWQPDLGPDPPPRQVPAPGAPAPERCALDAVAANPPDESGKPVASAGATAATTTTTSTTTSTPTTTREGDVAGAHSPRDVRYGARDPETGVRVSVMLGDNPTMNARPLAAEGTQRELAACFAKNVKADKAVTVAIHANLSVDARGHTRSATVTPEPSDLAAPPSSTLQRCLQRVLQKTAFDCSPTGQPTQARASFCLRRD